jgi:hypothetical protein
MLVDRGHLLLIKVVEVVVQVVLQLENPCQQLDLLELVD